MVVGRFQYKFPTFKLSIKRLFLPELNTGCTLDMITLESQSNKSQSNEIFDSMFGIISQRLNYPLFLKSESTAKSRKYLDPKNQVARKI